MAASFDVEKLESMSRAELQKLCKQLGIKANRKTVQLVEDLRNYAESQEEEKEKSPAQTEENICQSEETETKPDKKRKRTYSVEKKPDKKLHVEEEWTEDNEEEEDPGMEEYKKDLLEQLEKNAEQKTAEKGSKIPMLSIVGVRMTLHPADQTPDQDKGNKKWEKIHKSQFDKMDSIDVYLEKKRKRNEEFNQSVKKAKKAADDARSAVESIKQHKTPVKNARRSTKLRKPQIHTANIFKSPIMTLKDQKSQGFNFTASSSITKSTVFQFKAKSEQKSPRVSSAKKPSTAVPKVQRSLALPAVTSRRQTVATDSVQNENVRKTPKPRKSSISGVTPFRFAAAANTPQQPTPAKKFDLQASLHNKPLGYKPYTGKLKQPTFAVAEEKNKPKVNPYKEAAQKIQQRLKTTRTDVKNVKVMSRNERRKDVVKKRAGKRGDAMMARRGINV